MHTVTKSLRLESGAIVFTVLYTYNVTIVGQGRRSPQLKNWTCCCGMSQQCSD